MNYWVERSRCFYNAFYNTYYLKNEATHRVRCGEVFYKGVQKTDGEVEWEVDDFDSDLSNSHFWVETTDGYIIDWIVSFFMKRDTGIAKEKWLKSEVEAHGIIHRYYDYEDDIFEEGYDLYGKTSDYERSMSRDKKEWRSTE